MVMISGVWGLDHHYWGNLDVLALRERAISKFMAFLRPVRKLSGMIYVCLTMLRQHSKKML